MPSGRTHTAMSILAAGGLYIASSSANQPDTFAYALAGGCLAGILLTPDLDVDEPVRSHAVVERQFGFLPGVLWRLLWLPYARMIPHRYWLGHFPVIGTLLRLAYLGGIVWLVLSLLGRTFSFETMPEWVSWALIGLVVSDALHWAADTFSSRIRRLFYMGRRRRGWM